MGSRGLGFGVAMIAHTIYGLDAIAAAQALSEIGYLLRQDPKEVFRAKAFSAAAWSLALQRPDLAALQRDGALTSIEGVGAGIAKVLADLVETGQSRYLARLREQMRQPAREDESALDFSRYQGDIHSHTDWSDGRATMLEMAEGAKALGYRYLGITDHSPRIKVVNGLDAERLVAQSREMADVQARVEGLTLLQGIEVDILEDGSLDLPDAVLEILDVVIASPHVKLRQEATVMTPLGIMIEGPEGLTWERWRRICHDADTLGFASLRRSDHLISLAGQPDRDCVECWTSLALAAEWTKRIEFGPMVAPMTFRPPAVLAKIAAAVDALSGGRLLLGVGAGWNENEHKIFDIPFYTERQRFDRLEAGIKTMREIWSKTFPKPGRNPIPLLIGGKGMKR